MVLRIHRVPEGRETLVVYPSGFVEEEFHRNMGGRDLFRPQTVRPTTAIDYENPSQGCKFAEPQMEITRTFVLVDYNFKPSVTIRLRSDYILLGCYTTLRLSVSLYYHKPEYYRTLYGKPTMV